MTRAQIFGTGSDRITCLGRLDIQIGLIMQRARLYSSTLLAALALFVTPACGDDGGSFDDDLGSSGGTSSGGGGETGGFTTTGMGSAGESEGDPTGDGDGDPGTGDGDGDPGTGDGDGDPGPDDEEETGDGDGDIVDECNEDDDVILYLSPDDSNSISSPVQIKQRVLDEGSNSLSGVPVRVWEFMNYYGFDYPAADAGELSIYASMAEAEAENTYQLQLAVSSETMTPEDRPPMNVTLVLDTSGSMAGPPMELLKETCRAIAAQLQFGDSVSMVEWDTDNTWTLEEHAVEGPDDAILLDACEDLSAGGGTDLNGGLLSGYQLAQAAFDINELNRLVLVSDGGANAGVTDIELIAENAAYGGSDGIYLVGVGVDQSATYNDDLMDDVTDAGKGASVFLNNPDEVWKVFGTDFENTMAIAGRDVQVELIMPPGFEIVKFSGEEFSGDPTEVEPQHIAPNDAMVFHQQVETCAPEILDETSAITVTASWTDPKTFESKSAEQTWTFDELMAADQALLLEGAAVLAYAEALKVYKKALNNEQRTAALAPANAALAAALEVSPADEDLLEIQSILMILTP